MELILYIHIKHWDHTRKYFRSEAFENSGDGSGVSVVDHSCLKKGSGCVCSHAREYYPTVSSEPPIFWPFEESILPIGYRLEEERSDTGDICHRNIKGIKDGKEKKFFKSIRSDGKLDLKICDSDGPRPLRIPEDIAIWRELEAQ
ncbi:MAG TPA: hypothetical protein VIS96_16595 [Terrimicrobiaceae bacterium]